MDEKEYDAIKEEIKKDFEKMLKYNKELIYLKKEAENEEKK